MLTIESLTNLKKKNCVEIPKDVLTGAKNNIGGKNCLVLGYCAMMPFGAMYPQLEQEDGCTRLLGLTVNLSYM